ncbi:MAG: hypothetical protein HY260_05185 [Chloroflexi bacterium]|nr:hypothetical protein [Chloroflexota bacterium]
MTRSNFLLVFVGTASLLPYLAARGLIDLRQNTVGFEVAFFAAFALYLVAVALILRNPEGEIGSWKLALGIFAFALLFRLILLPTTPTLSDDMYRYVWDGRVQAHGLSPYRYPPDAPEVAELREGDRTVWPHINRKDAVTVYPPGAQMAYAAIWRVVGDSAIGFKTVFVLADLIGSVLLIGLLRHFGQPPERALIYLWSPLLIFEVAHAGHVDGLMLPLLIAAFWARAKEKPRLVGLSLGAATLVKLFPAFLLPALLPLPRPLSWKGLRSVTLPALIAFGGIIVLGYFPYAIGNASALGFLPKYFDENFNMGLARTLFDVTKTFHLPGPTLANAVTFGGLAVMGVVFLLRPPDSPRAVLWRCVWLIGWFTLFTQNLFSWYLLWLIPLIALFLEPGKLLGMKLAPASAWLIFTGTSALSYMFFVRWRVVPWAQAAEYWPLYLILLAASAVRWWPQMNRRHAFDLLTETQSDRDPHTGAGDAKAAKKARGKLRELFALARPAGRRGVASSR